MKKRIDLRFVGKWKGSDEGKLITKETNFWLLHRKADGTFKIFFETHFENGTIEHSSEQGYWYVINNKFYEVRESNKQIDIYEFIFLSPQIIQYFEITPDQQKNYIFKDYKVIDN